MKVFVVLSVILTATFAKPALSPVVPVVYSAGPVAFAAPIATSSQYHAQDELGQYSYGYSSPLSAKSEAKSFDGITRGGYSYVDAEGKLQSVEYTADEVNGFRIKATNLPVAPAAPEILKIEAPKPVEDTEEVAQAKTAHFAAIEEAKIRTAETSKPVEVAHAPALHIPSHFAALQYTAPSYSYSFGTPIIHGYSYAAHAFAPAYTAYSSHLVAPYIHSLIPVAPTETPEVADARAKHLAAVEEAKSKGT